MTPKKNTRAGKAKGASGKANSARGKANQTPGGPKNSLGKRKTDNFNKFYNKKRNSAIKEGFRQEKKAAKREKKEAIERHFEERRASRSQQSPSVSAARPTSGPGQFRPAGAGRSTPGKVPYSGRLAPEQLATGKAPFRPAPGTPASRPIPANFGKSAPAPKPAFAAKSPAPTHGTAKPPQTPKGTPGRAPDPVSHANGEQLPLNKYIAHGGICSRRDAAELVRVGKVTVNGKPVTEPGTKVLPTDTVKLNGKKVTISRNFVYVLLNKPKDYITTTDDPQGRRTVLDLIRQATPERVYPIGRLDRNTSGVLLLTNDGDLAQKLAHPSHQIKKIYHVVLDKPLTRADFDKIINGEVQLEDGPAIVDVMAYADPKDKTQIGLEIHSGRNRIVRRIFEHLGYDVQGLDRVMYAGLTKKNVQRGHWRLLTEKEVRVLKYLNSSIKGSAARAKEMGAILDPEGLTEPTKRPASDRRPPSDKRPTADRRPDRPFKSPRPAHDGPNRPANAGPADRRPAQSGRPHPGAKRPDRPANAGTPAKRPAQNHGKPGKGPSGRNKGSVRSNKKEK